MLLSHEGIGVYCCHSTARTFLTSTDAVGNTLRGYKLAQWMREEF